MKKLTLLLSMFALLLVATSCNKLKEDIKTFEGNYVEIDATVLNAPATAKTFPLLTRLPQGGRPVIAGSDPLITRTSGKIQLRVNLVSAQRSNAETLTFKVIPEETTAVAGTHYNTTGSLQIAPNSSFGFIEIDILNAGTGTGVRNLVVELESNATLKANPNYNRVGVSIAQN